MSVAHLHCHSVFSILDGSLRFDSLASRLAELRQSSVALTDHGTMAGIVKFQRSMRRASIKPILGCEFYVTEDMSARGKETSKWHLTVVAQNRVGYNNLCRLSSHSFLNGFYGKPRIDLATFRKYSDGLVVLSGCLASEVARKYVQSPVSAEAAILSWASAVPGRYYLELQTNGQDDQSELNDFLVRMHKKHNLPMTITSDVHYLRSEDSVGHKVSYCVRVGKKLSDYSWADMPLHLMSADEMSAVVPYADTYGALENTLNISDSVEDYDISVDSAIGTPSSSVFFDHETRITSFLSGVPKSDRSAYQDRIRDEVKVLSSKGFLWYILLLADLAKYASESGIKLGPGRGSAAGSLLCYALGITEVDPIEYGLLFERFFSPTRIDLPDIDIDVPPDSRSVLIDYLKSKYGIDCVSQLATISYIGSKGAIRDAARVMGVPAAEADALAKKVPDPIQQGAPVSIDEAIVSSPGLADSPVVDQARHIEGLPRHTSTHAAAIVISGSPIAGLAPLCKSKEGAPQIQYQMDDLDGIGLVKFDLLGLNTLSILSRCASSMGEFPGTYDDPDVFSLISSGRTDGLFQLESPGMRAVIRDVSPTSLGHLSDCISLYRPGPIGGGMLDRYLKGRRGGRIDLLHPTMEDILADTYGVLVYQEQAMRLSQDLAGYSPADSDRLRKLIGKKKSDLLAKEREVFVNGAVLRGLSPQQASHIFGLIESFGGYGFNKSHATAYAMLSYRCGYYKSKNVVLFYQSLLNCQDKSDDIVKYITSARSDGVVVLPPDINHSGVEFEAHNGCLLFGLGGIRNVGASAAKIVACRDDDGEYSDIYDVMRRTGVNIRVARYLVMAGCFNKH